MPELQPLDARELLLRLRAIETNTYNAAVFSLMTLLKPPEQTLTAGRGEFVNLKSQAEAYLSQRRVRER